MSSANTKNSSKILNERETSTKKRKLSCAGFRYVRRLDNITEYELSTNGLTVLCVHIVGSPTVTTNIVYRVGSQNEKTHETGLAHMLEHMLFKPTSGKGLKWKDLENKGANLNATTWLDRTLYYFNMPHEYLGDMLAVEADRMRNVLLSPKEFEPERANVLSEYEMYNSRPEMALDWHVVAAAFESHGYHHDTIGFRSDIEQYSIELLRSFYDQHYWPHHATLIVAGDFSDTQILAEVKKHFTSIKRPIKIPTTGHRQRIEAPQEGMRRVSLVRDTPIRYMTMAYKAPAFTSPDWTALQLALFYLTNGETSPLYKALVEKGYATSVESSLSPTKDPFLASFQVYATENTSYATIESAILNEISTIARYGIPKRELALQKELIYAGILLSRDGTMHIASELAEYVATGDWTRYATALTEIEAVSEDAIKRVVKEYLDPICATIGTIHKDTNTL